MDGLLKQYFTNRTGLITHVWGEQSLKRAINSNALTPSPNLGSQAKKCEKVNLDKVYLGQPLYVHVNLKKNSFYLCLRDHQRPQKPIQLG